MGRLGSRKQVYPHQLGGCCYPRWPSQALCNQSFGWRFCVVTLLFTFFCWCRGFSHRTESDLFLFLFQLCSWWLINVQADWIPTVGLPRHRHFLGFFNVPVQTPTGDSPFYSYSEKPLHFSRLLRHAFGYGERSLIPYLNLNHHADT